MADASSFTQLVPGFDFLQGLVKNSGAAMPNMGQWVAPTFDPEELEKRIEELKTVQFWLEQNARLLGATIQALEVQRMTLSTLKTMNVQMGDLRESMKIRIPGFSPAEPKAERGGDDGAAARKSSSSAAASASSSAAQAGASDGRSSDAPGEPAEGAAAGTAGAVDPMQWWGALTKQFTELATAAMKENPVGAMAKQSMEAANQGLKAMAAPAEAAAKALISPAARARAAAKSAAGGAAKPASSAARKRASPR